MANNNPGFTAIKESYEAAVVFTGDNGEKHLVKQFVTLGSAAVDSGNSPTTTLRKGNIVALKTSDSKYYVYDPDATDGTQNAKGVLLDNVDMLQDGTAVDRTVAISIRANLRVADLLNYDAQAGKQLIALGNVLDAPAGAQGLPGPVGIESKAANYTVLAADNGKLFLATAAVTFTLPTAAAGLSFEFRQLADANLVISAATSLNVDGNAGASTVTYSTASHKIGSHVRVDCVYTATSTLKWIVRNLGGTTMTIA